MIQSHFILKRIIFFLLHTTLKTLSHMNKIATLLSNMANVPLKTRMALSPKTLYSDSTLLGLNRTSLNSVNVLAHNRTSSKQCQRTSGSQLTILKLDVLIFVLFLLGISINKQFNNTAEITGYLNATKI